MCNMNFNQCCLGSYYPRPVCCCPRSRLIVSAPALIVVNPIIEPNWAYFNIVMPQSVWDQSRLVVRKTAGTGVSVNDNVDGSSYLRGGTYQGEYNGNAIIPSGGVLSVAFFLDNQMIEDSVATITGVPGNKVDYSGRAVFSLPINGGILEVKNISGETIIVNKLAMTINKIK